MYSVNTFDYLFERDDFASAVYDAYISRDVNLEKDDRQALCIDSVLEIILAQDCVCEKLDDRGCKGAPDWIIEIVSPASRRMDYYTKLFKYRTAGVREYWIVDPVKKLVMVYDFENEDTEQYTFQDSIKVGIYEELRIDFAEM